MSEVETDFLFEARVKLDAPIMIGATPEGTRMIVNVLGGEFEGPNMRGSVFANSGADWARIRSDGSGALDVRFCLETDDHALLYVHWQGIMRFAPEQQNYAMDFAKPDDPAGAHRYYFRTSPRFETSHPQYAWLNNTLCVSKSRTGNGGVIHRIFAIK